MAYIVKFTVPTFDLRNGTTVNVKPVNPIWGDNEAKNNYTLDSWHTTIDGAGENDATLDANAAGEAGTTYYAKWKNAAGHIVRTRPLNLSEQATSDISKFDAEGWKYEIASGGAKTLTLSNCTINLTGSGTDEVGFNTGIKIPQTDYTVVPEANTENLVLMGKNVSNNYGLLGGAITFDGAGSLNVVSGASDSSSYAVYGSSGMTVNNGKYTFAAGSARYDSFGINCSQVTISGGTVTVSGSKKAISVYQGVTATNATIKTSTTTQAGTGSYDAASLSSYKWIQFSNGGGSDPTPPTPPVSSTYTVSGTVKNSTEAPLQNATVSLKNGETIIKTALTDANGAYSLTGVSNGTYTLEVKKSGCVTETKIVTVSGRDVTENVALAAKTGTVSGIVKNSEDAAVSGAIVKLMKDRTQIGENFTTLTDGAYNFNAVEYGVYSVVVTKDGKTVTAPVILTGDTATVNLTVPKGNESTIVVTQPGTQTPATENDKGITAKDESAVAGGGSMQIKLTAESKDAGTVTDDANKIKELSKDSNADYLFVDLTVKKSVKASGETDPTVTTLKELNDVIEVQMEVPAEYQSKNLRTFRIHEGRAEELKKTANLYGEYFELNSDNNIATLHNQAFLHFCAVKCSDAHHIR